MCNKGSVEYMQKSYVGVAKHLFPVSTDDGVRRQAVWQGRANGDATRGTVGNVTVKRTLIERRNMVLAEEKQTH